jgi:ribonuclease Z
VDCGEGTQERMQQYKVRWFRINHIFISHLHGDHYYGLIGLLTTYNLLRRAHPLTIYGPALLKEIIELQLKASATRLNYQFNFVETQDDGLNKIFEDDFVEIHTFPLHHKIPTTGFLFRQKPGERRLLIEKLEGRDIERVHYKLLKQGTDVNDKGGNLIKAMDVTAPAHPARIYAFCSDTIYSEKILPYIQGADLLYHEATYLHDSINRAEETKHSTALQAAQIAEKANVKKLLIGHFSSRYSNLSMLLHEARSIFPETSLAVEGETFNV